MIIQSKIREYLLDTNSHWQFIDGLVKLKQKLSSEQNAYYEKAQSQLLALFEKEMGKIIGNEYYGAGDPEGYMAKNNLIKLQRAKLAKVIKKG